MERGEAWFGVEVKHLAALAAVSREGSFRAAAEDLGYVQSAVSQQIATLERIVGTRLVERFRGSKEVRLTAEGEVLVAHAKEILSSLHAARADLDAQSDTAPGDVLTVGVTRAVAVDLLPDVVRRIAGSVRIVPVEAPSDAALAALVAEARVDVAIGELPAGMPFRSCGILQDPCMLVAPADWHYDEPPTVDEIARLPLIRLPGWTHLTALTAWLEAQGAQPQFVLSADGEATMRGFVAAGLGFGISPLLGLNTSDPRTTIVDLASTLPMRRVAVFWNGARQLQRPLERFIDSASSVGMELRARRTAETITPPVLAAA